LCNRLHIEMSSSAQSVGLRHAVGRGGFFTLAFGAIVGSGWVVVLGQWLKEAGPGGAALGFAIGGAVMVLVGLCYGELAARSSTAGADFLYTLQTFGRLPAFILGWFLTLYQVSVCAFEGIALAWLLRVLIPGVALGTAYTVAGVSVTWDALAIGFGAALILGILHLRGAHSAIRFQNIATYGFIVVIAVLIFSGISLGSISNLRPLLPDKAGHSAVAGILWTFGTSAYFLNGWQAALHAIEERRQDVSSGAAVLCMVGAIGAGAIFYAAIIIACSMALPWQLLLAHELPAAAAFSSLGAGGVLGDVLLVAAIVSLTKTWSATIWMGTRLMFAQARHGLLPNSLATVHAQSGAPRNAVLLVTGLSLVGIALGRAAIEPIVNTLAICAALSMIVCIAVLLRRRRLEGKKNGFSVPGGLATIWFALLSASSMMSVSLVQPFLVSHGAIPIEWILLSSWGGVGLVVWFSTRRLRHRLPSVSQ
jgi:APA family basic amino acid/polyamine antiporter